MAADCIALSVSAGRGSPAAMERVLLPRDEVVLPTVSVAAVWEWESSAGADNSFSQLLLSALVAFSTADGC